MCACLNFKIYGIIGDFDKKKKKTNLKFKNGQN